MGLFRSSCLTAMVSVPPPLCCYIMTWSMVAQTESLMNENAENAEG